jgi:hypothetical protein
MLRRQKHQPAGQSLGLARVSQADRQDPTLSDTIRVLLLQQLAENSYLEDREKKALGVTA